MSADTKSFRRRLLLGVIAALICVAVAVALPPVQIRVARAFANRIPGAQFEVEHLAIEPWGINVAGLVLDVPGVTVRIENAAIDFAFWSSLTGFRLDIEAATLDGVDLQIAQRVDTSELSAEAEAPPRSFTGLRPIAEIPAWIRLRELVADGSVSMTSANDISVSAPWRISLSRLAADSMASAQLTASIDAQRAGEVLATSNVSVTATAAIDAAARVASLGMDAALQPVDAQGGLRVTVALELADQIERYRLDLDDGAGQRAAHVDALYQPDGIIEGNWELSLTPGVVAAFARGRSVADLAGTSTGSARIDLANSRASIQSSTALEGHGWEAFDTRLNELGALSLAAEVDAGLEPGRVDARDFQLVIRSAERGDLLLLSLLQPLSYETGNWLVDPEDWGEPALRMQANGLPLRWLRALSPADNLVDGQFSGGIEIIRDEARRTQLVVTEPLRAAGVQLAPIQGNAVPAFDITIVPHAVLDNGALEAEIEELTITASTGLQVEFQGQGLTSKTLWPIAEFEGSLSARVPALQRIMPQLGAVSAMTRMQFDFETLMLMVNAVSLSVETVDGRMLLSADLSGQQPLRLQLPQLTPDWDALDSESLSLQLDRVPIDWLSPYIPELELRGGEVSGLFTATGRVGEGLRLTTEAPLVVANLMPVYRGIAARQAVTVTMRPTVSLSTAQSSIKLEDLRVQTPGGDEIRGEIVLAAPADSNLLAVSLAMDAELPSLARRFGTQIGALHLRQSGTIEPASRQLNVSELSMSVADVMGAELLAVESLRPFAIGSEPFRVSVDGSSTEILRVVVSPLPIGRLLPNLLGLDLEGVLPQGEFFGRAQPDGRLVIAADEPLVMRDVSVHWQDVTLLDRVTASVRYQVAYSEDGFEARSVDFTATDSNDRVLVHSATEAIAPVNARRLLSEAHSSIEANLEPLALQPIFAELPPFTAGLIEADFRIDNSSDSDAETKLVITAGVRGAVTDSLGRLPDFEMHLDIGGVRGEHMAVEMPLRVASAEYGESDLDFAGTVSKSSEGQYEFAAALNSTHIAMSDIDKLIDVFLPAGQSSSSADGGVLAPLSADTLSAMAKLRLERHSVPVWTDHVRGAAKVELGNIAFPSFTVEGVRGTLDVTPSRAALTDIRAAFFGAELNADATIDFDAAQPKPYSLDFHAAIEEFDLARVFLAAAPGETPTADGRFELQSELSGTGLNPLDLGLSTLGAIRLTGRDGVFRGLAASAGTGSTAARVMGVLTFSRELKAVGRLLDGLGEMKFERAEIVFERQTSDQISLSNLFVLSPQLRLEAAGSLALAAQRPLLLSPLDVSVQLAARGDVAVLFDGMRLLQEEVDAAGYRQLTMPVRVTGTPVEPDTAEFWALLEQGANNARGSFGAGLRALNRRLENARSE